MAAGYENAKTKAMMMFQHGCSQLYIACFTVPKLCPHCGRAVSGFESTPLPIPPFVVPCPFVDSSSAPHCIVLRPTSGTFICDYTSESDLHVGITDSFGVVYHFDRRGIQCNLEGWKECIAVHVLSSSSTVRLHSMWSSALISVCNSHSWLPYMYSETDNNCYDFVMFFLRCFLQQVTDDGSDTTIGLRCSPSVLVSKLKFCSEAVRPLMQRAEKYINLYRRLELEGFIVFNNEENATSSGNPVQTTAAAAAAVTEADYVSTVF